MGTVDNIARKLTLGSPSHGPAGKPAVKRKRNSNKYSGGGGRRVNKPLTRGQRSLIAMRKARVLAKKRNAQIKSEMKERAPPLNPGSREPGHNWSGGGGRRWRK